MFIKKVSLRRYGYTSPLPGALGSMLWPLVRRWADWSDRSSSPGRLRWLPCSLGGRKRVASVAATITRLRSGSRWERAHGLGLPFPAPTSARAELVPERDMAQLGQG